MKIRLWLAGNMIIITMAGCMGVSSTTPQQPAVPVVGPVSIAQPGDTNMNCAQLAAESNVMDQDIANASVALSQPDDNTALSDGVARGVGQAATSAAIGALASFVPYAGYLGSAAGNVQALQGQEAMRSQIQWQTRMQMDSQALSTAQQRKAYLAALMVQEHCGQATVSDVVNARRP
jgi:hypothetical protein